MGNSGVISCLPVASTLFLGNLLSSWLVQTFMHSFLLLAQKRCLYWGYLSSFPMGQLPTYPMLYFLLEVLTGQGEALLFME